MTGAERRVARLVASGRRNDEVAGELEISSKTVEAHLTRIYRKLGVRSRTELAVLNSRPGNGYLPEFAGRSWGSEVVVRAFPQRGED